ncbi:MAG: signal peptidase I [Atopobiaceae bacterium]|nr:signal peptidase I [Atopobiaceae bacterium]MCH4119231.1 signal peptidase I [Atopobiaceae bacterium]MCI1317988.1 signal peptidase I [Atopobiaceae bacterium]MCI1388509.1 signal peptidase I [Atopobiaceae bacterium]MCI1432008.1 signal peptidase I [Atopobiaceae bacterium]
MGRDMGQDEPADGRERGGLLSWVIVVAVAIVAAFLIRTFVCEPFVVPTGSMEDTIEVGDYILGEKVSLAFSQPKQGDIVTFEDPEGTTDANGDTTILVKRVIATEGQTVELRDGVVYVDGEALDEPYVEGKRSDPLSSTMAGADIAYPYTVPAGCVWVMGDNRTNSRDSRYFGAISTDTITSVAFLRYWPLDRFGLL